MRSRCSYTRVYAVHTSIIDDGTLLISAVAYYARLFSYFKVMPRLANFIKTAQRSNRRKFMR